MNNSFSSELSGITKQVSHIDLWEVWQAGKTGEPLEGEDARLFQAMRDHPEQYALWDRLDVAGDNEIEQDGVNLVGHITIHTIVENQLAERSIPTAGQVLNVLQQKGLSRHEAIHAIASEAVYELHRVLSEHATFDEQRYVRKLRQLPLKIQAKPPLKEKVIESVSC